MDLFKPDNFSSSEVVFKKNLNHSLDFFLKVFNYYFKSPVLISIEELGGRAINSQNFRIKLETDDGILHDVLFRRCIFFSDQIQIISCLKVIAASRIYGAAVPEVLKTIEGLQFITHAGEFFVLFNFISGNYFVPHILAYSSLAQSLARLHRSFVILDEDLVNAIRTESQKNIKAYYNKVTEYSRADFEFFLNMVDPEIRVELTNLMPLIDTTARTVGKLNECYSQIIHSDMHPHNVLFEGDALEAILDFDALRYAERARDVGMALYRFGRQFFVATHAIDSCDLHDQAHEYTKRFIQEYAAVNPLTQIELEYMPFIVADEFIKKLLFVLRSVYIEKNTVWAADISKFCSALSEITFFWDYDTQN